MTEAEWLACENPTPMLAFLRGKASDRKLRLVASACCRRVWEMFPAGESCREAVEAAEAFADGATSQQARKAAREAICAGIGNLSSLARNLRAAAGASVKFSAEESVRDASSHVQSAVASKSAIDAEGAGIGEEELGQLRWAAIETERSNQAHLLRDIFGNPFRPVSPGPWVTPAAVTVARDVYDRRDFAALPLLADLLEEAGCPEQAVLDHLRSAGPHARGCWALDLILGES